MECEGMAVIEFWREVFTPSKPWETAYDFFLIAVAHAAAGAVVAWAVEHLAWLGVLGYGIYQVTRDLRTGRSVADSVADTGLVALGVATVIILGPEVGLAAAIWLVVSFLAMWARETARK